MVRKKRGLQENKKIFFFVEGETEEKYFNFLRQKIRLQGTKIQVTKPENTGDWVDKANAQMRNNPKFKRDKTTEVYVVFDKDNLTIQEFNSLNNKASRDNINIVFSNISFEVWLLAHFEILTSSIITKKQLAQRLKKHLGVGKYIKADSKQIESMVENYEVAVNNARNISAINFQVQSTNVGIVISKLK